MCSNEQSANDNNKPNTWLNDFARKVTSQGGEDGIIVKILSVIKNTNKWCVESWNCRWCQNHASQLPAYLYYQKQCATVIQINMVSTATVSKSENIADFSVESLAEKYKQGYRLDIDFISANKPIGAFCGNLKYKLMKTDYRTAS